MKLLKALALLVLAAPVFAISGGVEVLQNDASLTIGSMTVTGPGGATVTYGVVVGSLTCTGSPCGTGSGGASSLEVIFGNGRSSPTATVRANSPFTGSVTGSTNTLGVDYSSFTMQGNAYSISGIAASTGTLAVSTGSLQTQINSVGVATGAITNVVNGKVAYSSFSATSPITYNNATGVIGATQISLSSQVVSSLPAASIAAGTLGSSVIASSIAINTAGVPQLNFTGTPNSSTFARGDGTWSVPAGSGGSSALGVFVNSVQASSPTSSVGFVGPQVSYVNSGSSTTITISGYLAGMTSCLVVNNSVSPPTVDINTGCVAQLTASNTFSGANSFTSTTTFSGAVVISSALISNGSYGTNGQALTSGGPGTVPSWTTISGSGGGSSIYPSTGTNASIPQGLQVSTLTVFSTSVSSQALIVLSTSSTPVLQVSNSATPINPGDFILTIASSTLIGSATDYSLDTNGNEILLGSMTATNGTFSNNVLVNGSGNGNINLTISGSTYSVTSTSNTGTGNVTVGHLAVYSSTNGTITDGGVPGSGGGGTPGGSNQQLQYNNGGSFGGAPSAVTSSSITVLSSFTVSNVGVSGNPTPGLLDVYSGNASSAGGQPLLSIGTVQQSNQIVVTDEQPLNLTRYGANVGSLSVGLVGSSDGHIIFDANSVQNQINYWNGGEMDLETASTANGGKNIVLEPNTVSEVVVSSLGVIVSTSAQFTSSATVDGQFTAGTGIFNTSLTVAGNNVCQSNGTNCPASGGGTASTLQVTRSGVQITSPTASENFYSGDFSLSAVGSTSTIFLNPASTDFIQNTSVLQTGSTYYVSSGTVLNQLVVGNSQGTYLTLAGSIITGFTANANPVNDGNINFTNSSTNGSPKGTLFNNPNTGSWVAGFDTISAVPLSKIRSTLQISSATSIAGGLAVDSFTATFGVAAATGVYSTSLTVGGQNVLTGNQSITWTGSGDVTGSASGSTSISPTLTATSLQNNITTFGSSITVNGALGLNVKFGAVASSMTASSATFTGVVQITSGAVSSAQSGLYLSSGAAAGFDEYNLPAYVATSTIAWTNGNIQVSSETATTTYLFNPPNHTATVKLIRFTGVGGFSAPTFPASVKWASGTAPTFSSAAGKVDQIICTYLQREAIYLCGAVLDER